MTEPVRRPAGTILGRSKVAPPPDPLDESEPLDDVPAPDADAGDIPAARGSDRAARWPLVGCVVLAAVALVFAILALQQRSARQAQADQTNQLRAVSGSTVAALTNYDYQHLSVWEKSVVANATGSFQSEFQSSYSGFAAAYTAEQNRGTGTVQGVWLGSVATGKATTVVLVQIAVSSLTGTHTVGPLFMQLTLLKVAGRWRVDQIAYFDTSTDGSNAPGDTNTPPTSLP